MNNRAKLLISILFIAAIILTIGLTRFYFDVTKNNGKIGSDEKVESLLQSYGDMQVFRNPGGFCGVVNAEGVVVIEPEWMEILDITPSVVLVSRRIGSEILIGGIDFEENIVLPFVYKDFRPLGDGYKAGVVAADSTCIIYTDDYQMAFSSAYDAASYESSYLVLTVDDCSFWYSMEDEKPSLHRAVMNSPVGKQTLTWTVSNQVYLSELSEQDLLHIRHGITAYTGMLIADDFSGLSAITTSDYLSSLSKPGTMPGAQIDRIFDFYLTRQDTEYYDLAFSMLYRAPGEREGGQLVQTHLTFRRGTDNNMILTSASLDFQSTEPQVPAETEVTEETDEEE